MIDKRELRIGNWVLLKGKLTQMVPYDFVYWADKDFEPVELAPDILVKAGFEKQEEPHIYGKFRYRYYVDCGWFYIISDNDDEVLLNDEIHSVHHLQNLIRDLTGQELAINLK